MNTPPNPSIPSPTSTEWNQLSDIAPTNLEIPTTSPNSVCRSFLRAITHAERMENIKDFISSSKSKSYHEFTSTDVLSPFGQEYINAISRQLTPEEKSALKRYSGFDYKVINQVSRNQWNYDTLGAQTPEKVSSAREAVEQIDHAIVSAPATPTDFIAFRGTNLDSFNGYKIDSLSDLTQLENQFFLETGFTSTSLLPDTSFVDRDFNDPLRNPCNIEIKYRIPADSHDGVGLLSNELSYNPEQNEFLLNRYSLSFISNVKVDETHNRATMEMTLIPSSIYDDSPEKL